jgi:acetylornithine deacetylase/succinyl-diaminopimelate desuccinylase-like protein
MSVPADLEKVFAHIERNQESFIERVMNYVRHPSISAQNIGIAEVAALLVTKLTDLGFAAEAVPTRGHPMVVGRWEKVAGAPTVLLYGHYDVQPPEPLEAWITPPFEPTIRDGRIYARGIGDNKGQHFAQLLAIESHLAVHGQLPCNVIVLLEGEEEVGSPHIAEFIEANRERLKADLVITADGPIHASGRPTLTYGVRGMVTFELHCRHASRDVHSGNFGGVVPNPIWTLVHLLGTMKNAAGEITMEGFQDLIVPATDLEREVAARLPLDPETVKADLKLDRLDAPPARSVAERLMFRPTFTINGFYGGPGAKTVLP